MSAFLLLSKNLLTCKKLLKAKINRGNGLTEATIYYLRWVNVNPHMKVLGVSPNTVWQPHNGVPPRASSPKTYKPMSSFVGSRSAPILRTWLKFQARPWGFESKAGLWALEQCHAPVLKGQGWAGSSPRHFPEPLSCLSAAHNEACRIGEPDICPRNEDLEEAQGETERTLNPVLIRAILGLGI